MKQLSCIHYEPPRSYSVASRLRRTLQAGLTSGVNLSNQLAPHLKRNPIMQRFYQAVKDWMI